MALHFVWWDLILNRRGLKRFRTPYLPRWQKLAREYRQLALELGGVLIKLGQFLSTRVDILPPEITGELGELQDAVPPVPVAEVIAQIEADFGRPLDELFAWFDPVAIGAASVAQAHKARLITGESVAVKVLRPGIVTVVETDLKVIGKFIKRIKHYKPIRRFVDLERLAIEFTTVTARELDLVVEAESAERFARDFADDPAVYVPRIYWEFTAPHTLTMEDVSYIKIDDRVSIDAAGISRTEIVEKLFDIYQEQIVVTHFVHADPHAGNLFVRPLPHPDEMLRYGPDFKFKPGAVVPYYPDRPFQIVFVDFGMAVAIPKRLWVSLRNYIVGIGTEDAHLIVESYREGGILLGDSDLKQIEEFTAALLEKFSGSLLGQMKDVDLRAYADLYGEYQSLLYDSPFQFQSDLLFVMRALGILSGLATELAPEFDPFARVKPFAQRLIQEEWQPRFDEIGKVGPRFLRLPKSLFDVLDQAQRGQLAVQTHLPPDARRIIDQLQRSISRLTLMVGAVGLLLVGTIWHVGAMIAATTAQDTVPPDRFGLWMMGAGGVIFLISLLKARAR
ncbi:MAG: AarF/UbiB family protein [Acidobacteriota bacterium]